MDENNRFLGIAYLYTIINAVFSILSHLLVFFYISSIDKFSLLYYLLQFGTFAIILFVLYMLNRKQEQHFGAIYKDNTVRKSTGFVIVINGLKILYVYVYQVISDLTSIVNGNTDISVVPAIVSAFFYLCLVFVGLFLLKGKSNTYGQYNTGAVIGIVYIYTLITVVFSFISDLIRDVIDHVSLKYLLLWIACVAVILIVLYILNKKQNQELAYVFYNDAIRKSTGILIVIDGLVAIANLLNSVIIMIWKLDRSIVDIIHAFLSIKLNIINFVIFACQIGLGAYLLKYKSKTDDYSGS